MMMKNTKKLIIGILFLFVVAYAVKKYFDPKTRLEKLDREIEKLTDRLDNSREEIVAQLTKLGKKPPQYLFLIPYLPTPPANIDILLQKHYKVQLNLALVYEEKGDYFLEEEYKSDKTAPEKYKVINQYEQDDLLYELKRKSHLSNDIMKLVVETRNRALKNYKLATRALDDNIINLYALLPLDEKLPKLKGVVLFPVETRIGDLKIKNQKEDFSRLYLKNRDFRLRFMGQRVKVNIHYKMGKCYQQLTNYALLKKENLDKIKQYYHLAEKEFLISWGVQKHSPSLFNLAQLYTHRYEKLNENNKTQLLHMSEALINDYLKPITVTTVTKDFFGNEVIKERKETKSQREMEKGLFLLGKVYYLMGNLDAAQSVYRDRLLGTLRKTSPLYQQAQSNYRMIINEIDNKRRGLR